MTVRTSSIRPAAVAGSFYPRDGARLRAQLAEMLAVARAERKAPRRAPPKALIVPHAGYQYSGQVAARAYGLLEPFRALIRRVVLIGPSHRVAFRGVALPSVDAFWTPLGPVEVDHDAGAPICVLPRVQVSDAPHAWEHALEVQLPFLQTVLDEFRVVPLVVGQATPRDVAEILDMLWGDERTLIVVSSDLSHYHEYALAAQIDSATVASLLELDPVIDHEQACGATANDAMILCAKRRGLRPRLIDLRNSGDTAGARDRVVGYCSIAFDAGAEGEADGERDADGERNAGA